MIMLHFNVFRSALRDEYPALRSPEALCAYHKAETEKWWPIISGANIKAE